MKCPYCAEEIQPDAKKCRFCNEWLRELPANASTEATSDGALSPAVSQTPSPPSRPSRVQAPSPKTNRPANCPHCGFPARAGEHFCGRCGKILAVAKPLKGAPPLIPPTSTQPLPPPNQILIASEDSVLPQKLRRSKWGAVLLGSVLVSGYILLAVITSLSQNNLRVLAGAVKSYQREHSGAFPRFEGDLRGALAPYLAQIGATDDVYYQTNVGALYDSNEDLSGRAESEVPSPSTTILFNEDQGDIFGRRSVIFVDGHIEHVSTSEWERIKNASTLPPRKPKAELEAEGIDEEAPVTMDGGSEATQNSGIGPDLSPAYDVPALIGLNYQQVVDILGSPRDRMGRLAVWENGARLEALVEEDGSTIKGFILSNPHGSMSDLNSLLWMGSLRQDDERYIAELEKTENNETALFIVPR